MSGDNGRPTSSDVAHEAEDTRANLAHTLDQLRNNLRPENVMEEVVSNARIGAASVADNIAGIAKQYPIPAALVAAGSALLTRFFSQRSGGTGAAGRDGTDASRGSASRPPLLRNPAAFQAPPSRGGPPSPSIGETLAEVRDSAIGTLSAQGAALRARAATAYGSTSSQAGDAMQNVSRYLPHNRGEVRSKLSNLLEEQPLILGAIGLAIGAAIGAALPITETEDSLMGTTAHRLRETATDAARQEIDGLRAAAGEAVDNVRHAASDNFKTVVDKAGETFAPGSRDV